MRLLRFLKTPRTQKVCLDRRRLDLGSAHLIKPIYVIGDVHSCLDMLLDAEARIRADLTGTNGLIVMLGDYVDRGPASAAVLDHLTRLEHSDLPRVSLCGNHDDMFLRVIERRADAIAWLSFGGRETLMSYGVDFDRLMQRKGLAGVLEAATKAVPLGHVSFLQQLPVMARSEDYIFVHAGIRPGRRLEAQVDEDLLWIREPFLSEGPQLPFTVVHGHTISRKPVFHAGRIGIDTGAYESGRLSILKVEEDRVSLL